MDDRFLNSLRREPRPDFARSLGERLRRAGRIGAGDAGRAGFAFTPAWAAGGALAALVLSLVLFPSVRASAQAFLSLFRVRNFAAVPIDRQRVEALERRGGDPFALLGEAVTAKGENPQSFATAAEAFASAGWVGQVPAYLPSDLHSDSAFVTGETSVDARLDATKANETFAALGITDLRLPAEFDGARIAVHVGRAVGVRYRNGGIEVMFLQAPNPEISLPPGMDVARLGEIGLRIAGLDATEARRFASNVDWTSTLLVPVPADASVIREVEVGGHKGLLVEADAREVRPGSRPSRGRQRSTVLWSDEDRIYALTGNLASLHLVAMASSVR